MCLNEVGWSVALELRRVQHEVFSPGARKCHRLPSSPPQSSFSLGRPLFWDSSHTQMCTSSLWLQKAHPRGKQWPPSLRAEDGQMATFRGRRRRAFLSEAAQILSVQSSPLRDLEYPCPTCAFKLRLGKDLRGSPSVPHPPFTSPDGETP